MRHSKNKDINKLVQALIRSGAKVDKGTKHRKLRLESGRFVVIPSTPSDKRAFLNFKQDVKRASNFRPQIHGY
ncbi:hypothetical protein [Profundibacter sp.]